MTDIFLSYNREDQGRAKVFADAFRSLGINVWWDTILRPGGAYDDATETALRTAKAVVVLWSPRAIESSRVCADANYADRNKTLIPCMIEACAHPIMSEPKQTAKLSHWLGDVDDQAWLAFLSDVKHALAKKAAPQTFTPPQTEEEVVALLQQRAGEANARSRQRAMALDRTGALAESNEAVALYEALVKEDPSTFTPHLAASVSILARRLFEAGEGFKALEAAEKAVALYRALADDEPQAFTYYVKASVYELAAILGSIGQGIWRDGIPTEQRGAMAFLQEAAQVLTPLDDAAPRAFWQLFESLVRNYLGAAQAAGAAQAEIAAAMDALGVTLVGGDGQPLDVMFPVVRGANAH